MSNKILKFLKITLIGVLIYGTIQGIVYREKYEVSDSHLTTTQEKYESLFTKEQEFDDLINGKKKEIAKLELQVSISNNNQKELKQKIENLQQEVEYLKLSKVVLQEEIKRLSHKELLGTSNSNELITLKKEEIVMMFNGDKELNMDKVLIVIDKLNLTSKQREFFKVIIPLAMQDMIDNDILASLTITQAVWESGWGTSGRG